MPAALAKFGAASLGTQVMTAGGYDTRRTVLLYDVASDTWTNGPLLLRGTDNVSVLSAGGRVYVVGGEAGTANQMYDAGTTSWSLGPSSPSIRFASAAAVLAGRLHLIGGWNANNAASASLASHDVFDPGTNTWQPAAPLTTARNAAAAVALDGQILVIGGRSPGIRANDQTSLRSCEIYDPAQDRWRAGPDLPDARASLAAVAFGGRAYAFGGEGAPGKVLSTITRLASLDGDWELLGDMPRAVHGLSAVALSDCILTMGGFTGASDAVGSERNECWCYTPPA